MSVLVACESSGKVRDALIAQGVDAVSCDKLPSETDGPHIQADVVPELEKRWDGVIAHPTCRYLANSGVRWRVERQEWEEVRKAAEFFMLFLNANSPKIAVENPVIHKHSGIRKADFSVQPWNFGDLVTKRTCFWTKGLPPLAKEITQRPEGVVAECHLESPGPDRWKNRSRTYPGIAKAIAEQWGPLF